MGVSIIEVIFKAMRPGETTKGLSADGDEKTKD